MSYDSDMQSVIREAQSQGWRYQLTEKGHHQFYSPNGKDIVVASGTSVNNTGWDRFMADMKRAGFRNGLGTLGEAMPTALTALASKEAERRRVSNLTAPQLILDLMTRHPEGMSTQDSVAYIRSVKPELSTSSTYQALANLTTRGQLERIGHGFYRIPKPKDPLAATPPVAKEEAAPQHAAGESSGDPQIDDDLRALDEALAALARIESVVRKNRDVLHQLAQLKKAIGGIGK